MVRSRFVIPVCVALVGALGLPAQQAQACSAPEKCGGKLTMAPAGEVPANFTGVLIDPYAYTQLTGQRVESDIAGRVSSLTLTLEAQGQSLPVRVEPRGAYVWAAFDQALVPGEDYVLRASGSCVPEQRLEFTATAPEPEPTTLGALTAQAEVSGTVPIANGGWCSDPMPARVVDLTLGSPPAAAAAYRLVVDGKEWSWHMNMSGFYRENILPQERPLWFSEPGTFRVWTSCEAQVAGATSHDAQGLSPGKHTVKVRAELLGDTPRTLESSAVEVTLSCSEEDASRESGAEPAAASEDEDGCSLGHGASRGGRGWGLLLAALGMALSRRRRGRGHPRAVRGAHVARSAREQRV